MVSRLKGIETHVSGREGVVSVALDMFSRLKGIETNLTGKIVGVSRYPLDMFSRLKGIETPSHIRGRRTHGLRFGYGFPFEGN